MKSKKRKAVIKKSSCLSLDFLKHPKLPFHGTWSGLGLIIIGLMLPLMIITLVGLIIFVPSFGTMVTRYLRKVKLSLK